MNLSEFQAITFNLLKGLEKLLHTQGTIIGFGFASLGWTTGENFYPITKLSNGNHLIITFDSHLKTALTLGSVYCWSLCFLLLPAILNLFCRGAEDSILREVITWTGKKN